MLRLSASIINPPRIIASLGYLSIFELETPPPSMNMPMMAKPRKFSVGAASIAVEPPANVATIVPTQARTIPNMLPATIMVLA